MITKVHIVNFRSIKDLTLDLTFGEKRAPNGWQAFDRMPFLEHHLGGKRGVPCLALFGANAAGKSNILMALFKLRQILLNPKCAVCTFFDPNKIVSSGDHTTFEMEVEREGLLVSYLLSYNATEILHERLQVNGALTFEVAGKAFRAPSSEHASYDAKRIEEILRVECCNEEGQVIYPFLPVLGKNYQGLNAQVTQAFNALTSHIQVSFGKFLITMLPTFIEAIARHRNAPEEEILKEAMDLIQRLDVDIRGIEIVRRRVFTEHASPFGDGDGLEVAEAEEPYEGVALYSHHLNDRGEEVRFRFMEEESEGTKRLMLLVFQIMYALEFGSVLVLDEFDVALHPLLLREMLSLFQKRQWNPHGAQLIFTTHCTDLLDDSVLRLSEVGIVKKNISTGTTLCRLVDLKNAGEEIRNVTNFRKQYLDGFYSGIPYPAV